MSEKISKAQRVATEAKKTLWQVMATQKDFVDWVEAQDSLEYTDIADITRSASCIIINPENMKYEVCTATFDNIRKVLD